MSLVVFPEAYALGRLNKGAKFERLVSEVGSVPCDLPGGAASSGGAAPPRGQQATVSCLAKQHLVVLIANFFVQLENGTSRICTVAFDAAGAVLAVYHKHHLFPSEELAGVTAGPFAPTTFSALGREWGVVICYEGVYPYVSGDFPQMDALVARGASAFVWSVGGEVPLDLLSELLTTKYSVDMVASMVTGATPSGGDIVSGAGKPFNYTDSRVHVSGYAGMAALRAATIV